MSSMYPTSATTEDLHGLFLARDEQHKAFLAMKKAQEHAKQAKAEYEERCLDVAKVVDDMRCGRKSLPLFDKPVVEPSASDAVPAPETAATSGPPRDDDSWRSISLANLSVPETVRLLIEKADIFTVGQLADWSNSDKKLTDIKGIGPTKAAQIEDALAALWAERQKAASMEATEPDDQAETDESEVSEEEREAIGLEDDQTEDDEDDPE
jgi:hypothetical protein